ncbi:Hypothetical predicted protein [Lecanosticta acicola]|uniref:DUF4484 domain-containing protein n=1 Tax=Lecanosticta acicola TaxID=111012 RepID=A0AAI9ECJ8_9PEZI|nr:Hypothetical predicted protein [Lecanosticta acicola]
MSASDRQETPKIAAVFLVVFDQKVGYTIAWKRSLPDLDLEGVEYKSFPSGLHAVKEDLVYFIHAQNAGVSAFVQGEADAGHRNANFVAVGALVPLSYGQLGRSWVHAEELRSLARDIVKDGDNKQPLELFWKKHVVDETSKKPSIPSELGVEAGGGPGDRKRRRALSEATLAGFNAEQHWPAAHPALHVPALLDIWGPLLFPLYRAVLSRKRILLVSSPSVQANANTVYLASVLSGIPRSLGESLPPEADDLHRALPLFSVGIHDIPSLSKRSDDRTGWLACTTDEILGEKKDLYDLLAELPGSAPTPHKVWPKLRTSDGRILRASQRDLRRWTLLRRELRRLRRQTIGLYTDIPIVEPATDSDERPLLKRSRTSADLYDNTGLQERDESEAVEASSWSALAYRGFMWWASAGEASAWENEESKADEELLFDLPNVHDMFPNSSPGGNGTEAEREAEYARAAATLLVAYFRRITEEALRSMASIVEEADDNTEEGIEEDEIELSGDDVRAMGLDAWSGEDKIFVKDMMKLWFERDANVTDQGVRLCGVRIC